MIIKRSMIVLIALLSLVACTNGPSEDAIIADMKEVTAGSFRVESFDISNRKKLSDGNVSVIVTMDVAFKVRGVYEKDTVKFQVLYGKNDFDEWERIKLREAPQ